VASEVLVERRHPAPVVALGAGVVAMCWYLVVARSPSLPVRVAPMLVAVVAYGVVVACAAKGREPDVRLVAGATVVVFAVAVAVPPARSSDLYLYAMQGRIVVVHHASPYVHPVEEFGDDPLLPEVVPPYRTGLSSYGPAFTAVEAIGAAAAGPSPTRVRLWFQGLAAAAALASLWLVRKAGAGPGGLAFLALNPVVATKAVNEAHVDVLLGLLLVAAVVLAQRGRLAPAGLVVGLAVLVKLLAAVCLVALVVWVVASHGWRSAARAGAVAAVTVLAGYAAAGGRAALGPLNESALLQSRASMWARLRHLVTERLVAEGRRGVEAGEAASRLVTRLAVVVVVVLAALVVLAVVRQPVPAPALAVGGAYLAYLLAGVYAPAWYAAAVLPTFALRWRSPLAIVAAAHASLLTVAYVYWPVRDAGADGAALRAVFMSVIPALEVAAVVVIAAASAGLLLRPAVSTRLGR
jgi:Glycosyltransferase family 87